VSADVGARKPDPEIFRAALDRLGVPAADVWFVGDSWERDVRGAAAAGMRPIWFGASSPPPRPPPSCAVARDWQAVLGILLP
jgi:putative hydrolase of the HAD superfamily